MSWLCFFGHRWRVLYRSSRGPCARDGARYCLRCRRYEYLNRDTDQWVRYGPRT